MSKRGDTTNGDGRPGLVGASMVRVSARVEEHLEYCRQRNLRASTITMRRYVAARAERALGVDLIDASADELRAYLAARPVQAETRAGELSHLRGFYKWAQLYGYRDDEPSAKVPRPRLQRRLPRPLDASTVAEAIDQAEGRVRLMVLLMAYAGLRAGEVAGLRGEDVRLDLDPPVLFIADGKGGRQRIVPAHPVIVDALADAPRRGPLFCYAPESGRAGPLPAYRVSQLVGDHLRACGIDGVGHQLRHTFGTAFYRQTRDLRATQEVMGHASPVSTAGYAAYSPEVIAEGVVALAYGPPGATKARSLAAAGLGSVVSLARRRDLAARHEREQRGGDGEDGADLFLGEGDSKGEREREHGLDEAEHEGGLTIPEGLHRRRLLG